MNLTHAELQDILKRPGIRQANPDLGAVSNPKRESDKRRQSQDLQLVKSEASVVYRVSIISIRRKLVDAHDNLRAGAKPLVDAICASIGIDDGSNRISFEYGQVLGTDVGTIVRIAWISG